MSISDSSPNALILKTLETNDNVSVTAKDMIRILCGLNLVSDFRVTASVIPFPNNPTSRNKHAKVATVYDSHGPWIVVSGADS